MDTTPDRESTTDATTVVAELTRIIAHELDVRLDEGQIDPTTPLLEGGLMLDSMVLFELISRVEQRYGVSFPADDLRGEVFASLEVLARNIVAMIAARGEGTSP